MNSIVLFGEASKGAYEAAYICQSLEQLSHHLGEPPHQESRGLFLAIQLLMYNYGIIYFRVHEEGFSKVDYLRGLQFLENKEIFPKINALCLPGVGSHEIVDATHNVCLVHNSLLIVTEQDLYDYLTSRSDPL